MQLKISPLVFLLLIISSFFVMVYGRHLGGPWVIFEIFIIPQLPDMLANGDFARSLPVISALIGQILFLLLGLRTVKGYTLWLLLLSPLLVAIPVILLLFEMYEFQKKTVQSAIPFLCMIVVFYVHSFWKLKKNVKSQTA